MKKVTSYHTCPNCWREVATPVYVIDPGVVRCPYCGYLEITQEDIDEKLEQTFE